MTEYPSGKAASLWVDTGPETSHPQLEDAVNVDVAIVGGGIAGLTAALLLKRGGARVAVVEAGRVGTSVTGHTTGKLSSLHGLIYRELRRSFGEGGARDYGAANQAAIERVAAFVDQEKIECGFQRVANHTYAESDQGFSRITEEAQVAHQLGLPASLEDSTSLPFPVRGAVRFENQAQFHATKYLAGLAHAVDGDGSHVFEESRVTDVDAGSPCRIATADGSVTADSVIVATNVPIADRGLFSVRCHPHRSYLIALAPEGSLPEGAFISADEPLRSILPYRSDQGDLLLVGGEGHRASESVDASERYRTLEAWARERFPVSSLEYRWATQDALPVDGVPFVGPMSPLSRNLYVATGFRKWGLTNGTVAGMILSDRILGKPNPWASTFESNRLKPLAGGRRFVAENARAGVRFIRDRIAARRADVPDLEPGSGRVIGLDGEKVAVHKDERGRTHMVSAVCTHVGCIVEWNGEERTWDCPCHGSRFQSSGAVIRGPATEGLPVVSRA